MKEIKREATIGGKLDAISALEAKVASCHDQLDSLKSLVQTLESRIDDIENRSRQSN